MRISAVTQSYQSEVRKVEGARKTDKTDKNRAVRVDNPEISSKAHRLSETRAQVETIAAQVEIQPDVRMDKVSEVREKLEQGFYNSPEFLDKLTDKLMLDFGISSHPS